MAQDSNQTGANGYSTAGSQGSASKDSRLAIVDDNTFNRRTITWILARGSPLHGANGLYFGPYGYLYIASCMGGAIIVMDPNSGHIIRRFVLEQGMDGPDDLTFGLDGSLYWTVISVGRVGKMAPDGTQSLVAQLPLGVNPITFSDVGRLFVALDFLGDGLYEVYLDGKTPPRLIRGSLGFLNGFDFGPDGHLYGPIILEAKVVKIDIETGKMENILTGVYGTAAVKFGPDGMLYMVNQPTGEVSRMDLNSGKIEVLAKLIPSLDNLAFDAKGRLFVSSAEDGFIVEIIPDNKGRPVSPGWIITHGGVAVLPNARGGDVFIADLWTLRQLDGSTGRELFVERGDMWAVFTISPDGSKLIGSSFIDNAVYIYDPSTASLVDIRTDFFLPLNAIRFQGDLIVAEFLTNSVIRDSGPGDRQVLASLDYPIGPAATEDDLWVADRADGIVYQLVQDGAPSSRQVATDLAVPESLAVLPDGNLLVIESCAGRVSKINTETGVVTPFVKGLKLGGMVLSGQPPSFVFNGIAV